LLGKLARTGEGKHNAETASIENPFGQPGLVYRNTREGHGFHAARG
jgi:hypothetical protein